MSPSFTLSSALAGLAGGALIGLAASLLLVGLGRVAGVSGILAGALLPGGDAEGRSVRRAFLAGLLVAGAGFALLWPSVFGAARTIDGPAIAWLLVAGLLVGIGTRIGGGCTSGHGVCGISRGSRRSLVAVAVFMAVAMLTVYGVRLLGGAP
jgi:uncharacterized membrane protein YedE/YeeE